MAHTGSPAQPIRRIGVRALRAELTTILREVRGGQAVLVMSRDEVVAELRPPSSRHVGRKPGALRGKIRIAADFDETPTDLLDAMERGGG